MKRVQKLYQHQVDRPTYCVYLGEIYEKYSQLISTLPLPGLAVTILHRIVSARQVSIQVQLCMQVDSHWVLDWPMQSRHHCIGMPLRSNTYERPLLKKGHGKGARCAPNPLQ